MDQTSGGMEGFLVRGLLQHAWVALDRDVDLI